MPLVELLSVTKKTTAAPVHLDGKVKRARGGRGSSSGRGRGAPKGTGGKGKGGHNSGSGGKGKGGHNSGSGKVGAAKRAGGQGRSISEIPVFMLEEEPARLMKHAPPYGYKFGAGKRAFRPDELEAKRKNATLPAIRAFGSCAVVGSSGSLLHHRFGAEIDSHDAVFRVNAAPLDKTVASVAGTRTTWRLFSSPHASSDFSFHEERLYPNQTTLVLCDRPFVYSCQNVMFARRKPNMHNINPRFYEAVRRQADKRKHAIPLSGVVAVAVAMRSCDTVDVYGLSTMRSVQPTCYYYWSCGRGMTDAKYHSRPGDAEFHDFAGNAQALLRWNESGLIRLRTG